VSRSAWIAVALTGLALAAVIAATVAIFAADDGSQTDTSTSELRGFELPLTNDPSALALGGHDGNLLVGIAAKAGGPVEIAALRAETPVPTDELEIALDGRQVEAESCGLGCSRVDGPVLDGSPRALNVGHDTTSVLLELPPRLPPDGGAVFDRALRTMDSLDSYRFTERLSSGRGSISTRIDVQAPNRLRLRTATGFSSVIIGKTRWDFRDGSWQRAPFPGLDVRDLVMWHEARNPILGRSGNATELAAFGLQPVPAWFRIEVAPSGRVLEAEMTAASHFMLHRYSDFDAGVKIAPPR